MLFIPALFSQTTDPAFEPLSQAYAALRARDYDAAIADFRKAIDAAPQRVSIHKDLAYTYIKIGENELARDEFHEAMTADPADVQAALEYAFLANETNQQAEARRVFDRIRRMGNATAERNFHNIDDPLAAGIERWKDAIAKGADNFSSHFELARLAEQRDEPALAAEHYEKAWRLLPERRSVLVDLGRAWKATGQPLQANAALLAASRGGEPRAAELARELLPDRYPYVSEFRAALELDPENAELRRELGYLLLEMGRQAEGEREFGYLAGHAPGDLLSATQLGFLLNGRGESNSAMPLFDRVLAGDDEDLANRVRAVLRRPQVLRTKSPATPALDAKAMAERSLKAGYLKDAVRYLQIAHETDPGDFDVMRKLGWSYNAQHDDPLAVRWFDLARKSPDPEIAADAEQAWRNLRGSTEPVRLVSWFYPIYSTRWQDSFGYAQVKAEWRSNWFLVPYASVRFVGDTRVDLGPMTLLSESSFIAAVGVHTVPWRGVTGWFEAGSAIGYVSGHMLPDYRGGVSVARARGQSLGGERGGWFADTNNDGVFLSRFGSDVLLYSQSRLGYTAGWKTVRTQFYWNGNLTLDIHRQAWANYGETGPGVRVHPSFLPDSMYVTANLLRGMYFVRTGNSNFDDLRLGVWYAFSY